MRRKVSVIFLAAALCLLLTLTAFATDGAAPVRSAGSLVNPTAIIVCLVIGFLIAFIPMGVLKGQINNVHNKSEAADYTREGSFDLQIKTERFLHADLVKTPIPKNNTNARPNGPGGRP